MAKRSGAHSCPSIGLTAPRCAPRRQQLSPSSHPGPRSGGEMRAGGVRSTVVGATVAVSVAEVSGGDGWANAA
jgi:hypothetical protein